MNLHENKELFADALLAASQNEDEGGLGIKRIFIEKDYWITRSLKLLSESRDNASAVFKGGTSCSKAHGSGFRFSEDIDIAVTQDHARTDNQTKSLISRIVHSMADGLREVSMPDTRKFSKYRKEYYAYPQIDIIDGPTIIKSGMIQLEVVSFANPYPFHKKEIGSLLGDFLLKAGREDLVSEYGLEKFAVNVLDINRTATEKLVSPFRQSLSDDYIICLKSKIRHFYDLHFLWRNMGCRNYFLSKEFKDDFMKLFLEDRARFKEPAGWQNRLLPDSPLLKDFSGVWKELGPVYESELPALAYRQIPDARLIESSFTEIVNLVKGQE